MAGRTLAFAGVVAALLFATGGVRAVEPQGAVLAAAGSAAASRTLLNQYCTACHNDRTKAGGLILEGLDPARVGDSAELWEKVVRKLRMRAMPPAGSRRPDDRGYQELVGYLETELDRHAAAVPNPGRTDTFRRLTRTEYQNAIRDLFALDIEVADLLPRDDASYGFDNVGAVGLSPTLVERYLSAAQKVTRLAVGSPVSTLAVRVITLPPDVTQEEHVDGLPFGTRGGTIVRHTFPRAGEYEIQVRLMRNRNENVEGLTEPHQLEVTIDGERLQLFTVTPNRNRLGDYYADEGVDKHLQLRVPVTAGPHAIGAAFLARNAALVETERQPYDAHFNMNRHPRLQPAVHTVSITGPLGDPGSAASGSATPSRQRIFVCEPAPRSDGSACAKQ